MWLQTKYNIKISMNPRSPLIRTGRSENRTVSFLEQTIEQPYTLRKGGKICPLTFETYSEKSYMSTPTHTVNGFAQHKITRMPVTFPHYLAVLDIFHTLFLFYHIVSKRIRSSLVRDNRIFNQNPLLIMPVVNSRFSYSTFFWWTWACPRFLFYAVH